ncbi:hypothetical protein DID78_00500 [Candidatus Marinamargulisbacteria bacterium SCGC AG-343-D04]|nr:hypothetical protein DID78_00500 [Candidatus Marinamargulisbacteria bacterium SCGC AG-343-D04]
MNEIEKNSYCKTGAFCSIIAGISYLMVVIFAFMMPPSIATYIATETFFNDFLQVEDLFINLKIFMLIANITMIGVVCCFSALSRENNKGWVSWISVLAIIGYAFGIFQCIIDISIIPKIASQYVTQPQLIKDTIIVLGVANPMLFFISLGLPGVWFISVSVMGFNNKDIPKLLIVLGLLWGVGNILTAIAHAFVYVPLIYLVAMGAMIAAPAWGFMEGLYLLSLTTKKS